MQLKTFFHGKLDSDGKKERFKCVLRNNCSKKYCKNHKKTHEVAKITRKHMRLSPFLAKSQA